MKTKFLYGLNICLLLMIKFIGRLRLTGLSIMVSCLQSEEKQDLLVVVG